MKTEWYREGQTFVFYICGRSEKGAGIADRAERQPIERGGEFLLSMQSAALGQQIQTGRVRRCGLGKWQILRMRQAADRNP